MTFLKFRVGYLHLELSTVTVRGAETQCLGNAASLPLRQENVSEHRVGAQRLLQQSQPLTEHSKETYVS
jgi:hypothetical protein